MVAVRPKIDPKSLATSWLGVVMNLESDPNPSDPSHLDRSRLILFFDSMDLKNDLNLKRV